MKQINFPKWSRLDNTAKIFPSNSTPNDSKVFRLSCELKEAADPAVLQHALDKTLEEFPLFRSVMKKGLFWYYLEESALEAAVGPEVLPPCAPLYDRNSKTLLFRAIYYGRRISLEVYHVLADGAGALQFFCTMLSYYLFEKHKADFSGSFPEVVSESSQWQKGEDGFQKYYERPRWPQPSRERNAYRLRGERLPENRLGIVEGCMRLDLVLDCARSRNVTLTELMTAVLILAVQEEMSLRDSRRPVVITVPVNLRGYFPSESARNFFEVFNIRYDFRKQENSMEAVLSHVKKQFHYNLEPEQMRKRMNQMCLLEHSLPMRMVPLFLKDPVLRAANVLAERKTTASFSNVGRITLPKGMERYVRLFSTFAAPNMVQASACSFQEQYVVSFAGPFCRHDVERAFFRRLVNMGIDVTITTNFS